MKMLILAATAAALLAGASVAEANPVEGAAIGAGSGALIAGPPGAVVGGVAGAVVGSNHRRHVRRARVIHHRDRH
jgi:osmotically inducible lipoprotein OsmB